MSVAGLDLLGGGSSFAYATLAGVMAKSIEGNAFTATIVADIAEPGVSGDLVMVADTGAEIRKVDAWTYIPPCQLQSVSPRTGQSGTTVTLTGITLQCGGASVISVTLAGVAATIKSQSATEIVVESSSGSGAGDVVITADNGGTDFLANAWEFSDIASVDPATGQFGTYVNISGNGLFLGVGGVDKVTLAGVDAEILSATKTEVIVRADSGSEDVIGVAGDVVVSSVEGTRVTQVEGWTYIANGAITKVYPASGQVGTIVTITGTGMLGGSTDLTAGTIAGVAPINVLKLTDTEIIVEIASSSAGTGDIVLTADTGAIVTGVDAFEYLEEGVITSLSLEEGQFGTETSIYGTNMLGGGAKIVSVSLAGVEASIVRGKNNTEVLVTVPKSAPNQGDIILVADTGARTVLTNGWQFNARGGISSVSPASGHFGTVVTISGEDLLGGGNDVRELRLADVNVLKVVSVSDSEIVVIADTSSDAISGFGSGFGSGIGNDNVVIISNTGAKVTAMGAFEYVADGVVNEINPDFGQVGTRITINGEGLLGGGDSIASVSIAGVDVSDPVSNGDSISFVAPAASDVTGPVVIVADSGAIVTSEANWTFITVGSMEEVVPNSGQTGAKVTISGSNLLGGGASLVSAHLGAVEATIISESDTKVVVVVELSSASSSPENVVFVANSGAIITGAELWSYTKPGQVSDVSPNFGQFKSVVEITGSNLRAGGSEVVSVSLSGQEVIEITSESDTSVEVIVAAGPVGYGDVVLTADTGAYIVKEDGWKYHEQGRVDVISPDTGVLGTRVTIEGENLFGGGNSVVQVSMANIIAESIDYQSDDKIVVTLANRTTLAEGTCNKCDPTCADCDGVGSDECFTCNGLLTFTGDGTGSCESVCESGVYREGTGEVKTTAYLYLENVDVEQYDTPDQRKSFEEVLQPTLLKATGLSEITCVVAAVEEPAISDGGQFQGALLTIVVTANQVVYETLAGSVESLLISDEFLADLKTNIAGAYFFVNKLTLDASPELDRYTMCQDCDSSCSECFGKNADECIACADGLSRLENTCLPECPADWFYDEDASQCKPLECQSGRYLEDDSSYAGKVEILSETGAVITSDLDFQYLHRGFVTKITPKVGQLGTAVSV